MSNFELANVIADTAWMALLAAVVAFVAVMVKRFFQGAWENHKKYSHIWPAN